MTSVAEGVTEKDYKWCALVSPSKHMTLDVGSFPSLSWDPPKE